MTRSDPWDDPEMKPWLDHVRSELVPMIQRSSVSISLIPGEASQTDIKYAVELGLSIMMGKPLIVVVPPGRQVPPGLVKAADEIVEWDGTGDPTQNEALMAAVRRVHGD